MGNWLGAFAASTTGHRTGSIVFVCDASVCCVCLGWTMKAGRWGLGEGQESQDADSDSKSARPFTESGAGQLDADLAALQAFFAEKSPKSLRRVFARVSQCTTLLSVHRVDEVPDMNLTLLKGPPEIRRLLMLRRDLLPISVENVVKFLSEWKGDGETTRT